MKNVAWKLVAGAATTSVYLPKLVLTDLTIKPDLVLTDLTIKPDLVLRW